MKRFILFTFSLLLTFTVAIAQDGINYQGAATDGNGDELTTQNISIRASVLSTSASGNLEWEETHSTTTDQFGLFNVVIGQGTNTTNGATTNFDEMDWGSANHFLKIEMDATGGTNYAMIGTTQMMSVPYALYAKSAGIDSAMLANMIGSSAGGMGGGSGCDYSWPEGKHGNFIDVLLTPSSHTYTVPSGKNLYITKVFGGGDQIIIDGVTAFQPNWINGSSMNNPHYSTLIAGENQVVSKLPGNLSSYEIRFIGILVDASNDIQPITESSTYTVPNSSILVITYVHGTTGSFQLNGTDIMALNDYLTMPLAFGQGSVLETNGGSFNGYLADENYFANCGGGGGSSSSASAVDSAMVAGMIANAGGGGSFGDWEMIYDSLNYGGSLAWGTFQEFEKVDSDGFLYVIASGSVSLNTGDNFDTSTSVFSGNYNSQVVGATEPYLIPMKKDMYWQVSFHTTLGEIPKMYFIPGGGGGGSSSASAGSMSVSIIGDTLTMNGQSIIIPGISYQNTPSSAFGSVTDIDGNTYQTIDLGLGGEWMIDDLRATRFSNGDPINLITGSNSWNASICTSPGYIEHNNVVYYNGYTIDDSRNVCPTGWSVPTILDYEVILDVFNEGDPSHNNSGTSYGKEWDNAGKALKSTAASPNGGNYWSQSSNNNYSYLSFLLHNQTSCGYANTSNPASDPSFWTSSEAPWNSPSKWIVRLQDGTDLVRIFDWSYQATETTRCIKD